MPTSGKFIVFEGLSGNTKSTQLAMLVDYFQKEGRGVVPFKFPQYDKDVVGRLIKDDYLKGVFGDPMTVHPKLASLPFLVDRLRATPEIAHFRNTGFMVVSDRWWPTNAAYQGAKLPKEQRQAFFDWLEAYEFDGCHLLCEDVGIYLRTSPETSLAMVESRGAKAPGEGRDGQEKTDQSQFDRYECYEKLLNGRPNWCTIECLDDSGKMRTREEIHADICKALNL